MLDNCRRLCSHGTFVSARSSISFRVGCFAHELFRANIVFGAVRTERIFQFVSVLVEVFRVLREILIEKRSGPKYFSSQDVTHNV